MYNTTHAEPSAPRHLKRRWYQFSLRTLLIVTTLFCAACGFIIGPPAQRHAAVQAIEAAGGHIEYAARPVEEGWWRRTLRERVPKDWLDDVIVVHVGYRGEDSDSVVDGLEHFTALQILWLDGKGVTDAELVHLKPLTALKELNLAFTPLTGDGLVHIKNLTSLDSLCLQYTQLADAGLVHLKGLTGLRTLWLAHTNITDAGLVHLKQLTGLQSVWLTNTNVTAAGVADLQQALPKCRIFR